MKSRERSLWGLSWRPFNPWWTVCVLSGLWIPCFHCSRRCISQGPNSRYCCWVQLPVPGWAYGRGVKICCESLLEKNGHKHGHGVTVLGPLPWWPPATFSTGGSDAVGSGMQPSTSNCTNRASDRTVSMVGFSMAECIIFPYWGGALVAKCWPAPATPWTVARHAPPSMGFSRREYWSELPFPSPGDLPDLGIVSDQFLEVCSFPS